MWLRLTYVPRSSAKLKRKSANPDLKRYGHEKCLSICPLVVGPFVGARVGTVGNRVGLLVGLPVGACVGWDVGSFVADCPQLTLRAS